jgi:hypothetical protein
MYMGATSKVLWKTTYVKKALSSYLFFENSKEIFLILKLLNIFPINDIETYHILYLQEDTWPIGERPETILPETDWW